MKAKRVASRHPGHLVLGADQMLDCDGEWFDKPADRAEAKRHLQLLRGRSHKLVSTVANSAGSWTGSTYDGLSGLVKSGRAAGN